MRHAARDARHRRTQEERSTEMRLRLLDATVDCLYRLGYAGTTTVEVSKRARVSRGAQLHHFPTKAALVTAAVEHVFELRRAEFRAALARLPSSADRRAAAIDLLWTMVSGPTFYAWLELLVAARTDRELAQAVSEVDRHFGDAIRDTFRELFPALATGGLDELIPSFTFAVLQGIALGEVVERDRDRSARLLGLFHSLSRLLPQTGITDSDILGASSADASGPVCGRRPAGGLTGGGGPTAASRPKESST